MSQAAALTYAASPPASRPLRTQLAAALLGDDTEKARKTVTIRIQRALRLLDSHHPALASHLREAVRTGTTCSYQPAELFTWEL
jgi:hypothetical protein